MDCCHDDQHAVRRSRDAKDTSYTCPMHPEVVRGKPGMCPECGMNLVPKGESKHEAHAGHRTEPFLQKFWVALALSIPLFLYSPVFTSLTGIALPGFSGFSYVQLLLGSILFFYCGAIFLTSARRELKARAPGMMALIALAITTAYLWSAAGVVLGRTDTLFWELGSLIAIMLLGHWLEMRAVKGARGALKELSKLLPDEAEVERGGGTVVIPLAELKEGDIVRVKPGARVPADGRVIEGVSDVNESLVTGESRPVGKKKDDEVIAGSINGDGALRVNVSHVGEKTFLAGIARLVEEAQASKSHLQLLSDRAAFYLTIAAVAVGTITFGSWFALGAGIAFATERLVAVLVIACPHALGLAVPLVASISTTKAAENGLLVKRRLALEAARGIDTVLFDKTGTLTKGEFAVVSSSSDEALALAAAVEAHSEHPIAKAIIAKARQRKLATLEARDFKRIPGKGAEATVDGKRVFVGQRGGSAIEVVVGGKAVGTLALADEVRPEAREAVRALRTMGLTVAMVTGDSEEVARDVSRELGIATYFARVFPGDKQKKVSELQERGATVAFVGDGVNDAPALAQADLGLAIGAGTNVAIESAGIILVKNDPRDIPKIFSLSRLTYQKMIQNLWWAAGYNIIAIPLAAGVLASWGIVLVPALAAILMSVSTVIVAWNALLLRRRAL